QYITLGLAPEKPWEDKQKCFRHAVKHHCTAPPGSEPDVQGDYQKLCDLTRRYASQEALRLTRLADLHYKTRAARNDSKEDIADEAFGFFVKLLGHTEGCPDWLSRDVYDQIIAIRDKWI